MSDRSKNVFLEDLTVNVKSLEDSKRRIWEQDTEGAVGEGGKGKGANEEALVRVLRELSTVQRNLANLQVELQGRQVRVLINFQVFTVCGARLYSCDELNMLSKIQMNTRYALFSLNG